MKKILLITLLFLCNVTIKAQGVTLYTNKELSAQVSANYAYRTAAEYTYKSKVDNILEKTEKIRNEYAKLVIVKEHIHNSLVNVNQALKQSKQVLMFPKYIQNITDATSESITIASENPELLPYCNKAVGYITNNAIEIYSLLHDFVLKTDSEQLMDYRERQKIIDQLRSRLIILQGSSYSLVNILKYRRKISFMNNFLRDYLPREKILINQIMGNYGKVTF